MSPITIERIVEVLHGGPLSVGEIADRLSARTHHDELHPVLVADVDTMIRHEIARTVDGVGADRVLELL